MFGTRVSYGAALLVTHWQAVGTQATSTCTRQRLYRRTVQLRQPGGHRNRRYTGEYFNAPSAQCALLYTPGPERCAERPDGQVLYSVSPPPLPTDTLLRVDDRRPAVHIERAVNAPG